MGEKIEGGGQIRVTKTTVEEPGQKSDELRETQAEIGRLKAENERLKAELQNLAHPAVAASAQTVVVTKESEVPKPPKEYLEQGRLNLLLNDIFGSFEPSLFKLEGGPQLQRMLLVLEKLSTEFDRNHSVFYPTAIGAFRKAFDAYQKTEAVNGPAFERVKDMAGDAVVNALEWVSVREMRGESSVDLKALLEVGIAFPLVAANVNKSLRAISDEIVEFLKDVPELEKEKQILTALSRDIDKLTSVGHVEIFPPLFQMIKDRLYPPTEWP